MKIRLPVSHNIPLLSQLELNLNWITFLTVTITLAVSIGKQITGKNFDLTLVIIGLVFSLIPAFIKSAVAELKAEAIKIRDSDRTLYSTGLKREEIINFLKKAEPAISLTFTFLNESEEIVKLSNEIIDVLESIGWEVKIIYGHTPQSMMRLTGVKIFPNGMQRHSTALHNVFTACNISSEVVDNSEEEKRPMKLLVAYHP